MRGLTEDEYEYLLVCCQPPEWEPAEDWTDDEWSLSERLNIRGLIHEVWLESPWGDLLPFDMVTPLGRTAIECQRVVSTIPELVV